jgi:hypothetical protein
MRKGLLITVLVLVLGFYGCEDKKSNNSSTGNGGTPSVKHPYAYGYSCEAGDVVNGYALPPCPDPELNDSTLLGIDSNNNGVRDDVERWLIVRYKNDHKIVTEIGFQTARASQEILKANPKTYEEALVVDNIMHDAFDCNSYFRSFANIYDDPILLDHTILTSTAFKTAQFNTEARIRAYFDYDKALSGGVYNSTQISQKKAKCSFDVDKLLGE